MRRRVTSENVREIQQNVFVEQTRTNRHNFVFIGLQYLVTQIRAIERDKTNFKYGTSRTL